MHKADQAERLKICFCFPYHEVSGVPVLFRRIINRLVDKDPDIEIAVIDYADGAMARYLVHNDRIQLIPFTDGKLVHVPEDAILIMQSILPYSIRPELAIKPHTKIVFWNLHPDCLVPTLLPLPGLRNLQNQFFSFYHILAKTIYPGLVRRLRNFLYLAIEKRGIWFMDGSNLIKTTRYLFAKNLQVEYMPVPADSSAERKNTILTGPLKLCWIGRLCDFKSHILMYTIKSFSAYSLRTKRVIHYFVIGTGPYEEHIKAMQVEHEYFKLTMVGNIDPVDLDKFLLLNADIVTAMGTSALEGAKLAIPTILLDISYTPVPDGYRFRWIHDTKDYDLGHDLTTADFLYNAHAVDGMVKDLDENYDQLAERSVTYFELNHSMENMLGKFIEKAKQSELKYEDIDPALLKKSFARKIYNRIKYRYAK